MVRRGRSASPPPSTRRTAPVQARAPAPAAAAAPVPARAAAPPPPPAPMAAPPSAVGMPAPQQPSMFQQMAATAGGVAVGSAIGHTVGHGLTSLFSGSGDKEAAAPAPAAAAPAPQQQPYFAQQQPNEPQGACAWELKQFIQCAQGQADLTLCEGFNEALRQCKQSHHLQ
nr:coiled-coil-helix-coiled-coil-helix domain-containing protein 2 [Drosophila suzukii]